MGAGLRVGARLPPNDGVPLRRGSDFSLERRRDPAKCHCPVLKTQHQLVPAWSQLRNFSCPALPPHLLDHPRYLGHNVRELLIFEKKVQVHMATRPLGPNRPSLRNCVLPPHDLNPPLSGPMLNHRRGLPSHDVIP